MDRKERDAYLREHLKKSRYQHSLGVEAACVELAERFGADTDKAARAGLIHDCAKGMSEDEQREAIEAEGLKLDELWMSMPELLHGPAGVHVARTVLGEDDPEVLDAICHHTIPATDPGKLAKIVFLADMMEPNRDFEGVKELRRLAKKDLDAAFLEALAQTVTHNVNARRKVHPRTLEVYNRMIP